MKTCKKCLDRKWCQEICLEMIEQIKPDYNEECREIINRGLYDYLLEYKFGTPLETTELDAADEITLISRLYWSDGMPPARISELVRFSVREVVEIISAMQFILEKTIEQNTRSEMTKLAIRLYFYERKTIMQIARELDVTYLNLYKSIRRAIENIRKCDKTIGKHISSIERLAKKNENIQEK